MAYKAMRDCGAELIVPLILASPKELLSSFVSIHNVANNEARSMPPTVSSLHPYRDG